jgi:hypothetical protein
MQKPPSAASQCDANHSQSADVMVLPVRVSHHCHTLLLC